MVEIGLQLEGVENIDDNGMSYTGTTRNSNTIYFGSKEVVISSASRIDRLPYGDVVSYGKETPSPRIAVNKNSFRG